MTIPKLYSDILETDKALKAIVYSTAERYANVLEDNNLLFFEEYTDHGIKHIENVLRTTIDILPQDSIEEFIDVENTAILILSVILHDIGMHQTYKSFSYLISQDTILIPEMDRSSWSELWEAYIDEARKFTSSQKSAIFGDYDYAVLMPNFEDVNSIDGYQKKLVGEFIRRHHPRIAHETALFGFNTGDEIIEFGSGYEAEKLDIIGIIARSHGMNIRDVYEYMYKKFYKQSKTPYGIHVYYLMTILRIADFFQIDIHRLAIVALKLRTFTSPLSESEHAKHFAIKEIRIDEEDSESLYVRAMPPSNELYWKLLDLLDEIQNELDRSWAILGEKYGKSDLKPKLKYRRITSNLNEDIYLQTLPYVPEKFIFDANADLAKLLVEPLYGSNPTYAVRELLQNAVDAIHERKLLHDKGDYSGKVEINITHDSREEYLIEIKDNGKGMNSEEIRKYFLKAGATNRKSKEWHGAFMDKNNNVIIQKTGKFGVGILAAFLIGDVIEVCTRRFDSKIGLTFSININSKDVNVIKVPISDVGTTIKIKIKPEALYQFQNPSGRQVEWDKWYTLDEPTINYKQILLPNKSKWGNLHLNPSFASNDPNWHEFFAEGYTKIRWSYDVFENPKENYQLTCNGIIIPNPPNISYGSIRPPHVQVFDFNGILPINLNRESLDSDILPFERELVRSVFRYVLLEILKLQPDIKIDATSINFLRLPQELELPNKLKTIDFFAGFVYTTNGYFVKHNTLIKEIEQKSVVRINMVRNDKVNNLRIKVESDYILEVVRGDFNINVIQGYSPYTRTKKVEWMVLINPETSFKFFEEDDDYKIETRRIRSYSLTVIRKLSVKKLPIDLGSLSDEEFKSIDSIVCLSSIKHTSIPLNSEFSRYIGEVFPTLDEAVLPYDVSERNQVIQKLQTQF